MEKRIIAFGLVLNLIFTGVSPVLAGDKHIASAVQNEYIIQYDKSKLETYVKEKKEEMLKISHEAEKNDKSEEILISEELPENSSVNFNDYTENVEQNTVEESDVRIDDEMTADFEIELKSGLEEILNSDIESGINIEVIDSAYDEENEYNTNLIFVDGLSEGEALKKLESIEGVLYAEPNYKVSVCDAEPEYSKQWVLNGTNQYGINLANSFNISKGENVLIGVIDTGIDINHPDLEENIFTNSGESMDGTDSDGNGYIDDIHGWDFTTYTNSTENGDNTVYDGKIVDGENTDSHGTHVAGIIAAAINEIGICGTAPKAKILPIKALDNGEGTVFNIIKSIEYAEMMGADIVNCSWSGGAYSKFMHDAIKKSNMIFICAAGNDGVNLEITPAYPASYELDNVISVCATNESGALADFSNYGVKATIAAPGVNIYSTLPENTYGFMDGTSMAAPYVTGAAALLFSKKPDISHYDMKNRIKETASVQSTLSEKTESGGIIDAYALTLTSLGLSELNTALCGAQSVVVNNEIYVMGGYTGNVYKNTVLKYNLETGSWCQVAEMPLAVSDFSVAVKDSKIYIVGGTNGETQAAVWIYDTELNIWESGVNAPSAVCGAAFVQKDDYLYLFGGTDGNGFKNTLYVYNISEDSWEIKEPLEKAMAYGAAVKVGGAIYVIGGESSDGCIDNICLYDKEKDLLKPISKMDSGRKDFAAVSIGNRIYITGGTGAIGNVYGNSDDASFEEGLCDTVEIFDTDKKVCSISDATDVAGVKMSMAAFFGNIYLIGGRRDTYSSSVTKFFAANVPFDIRLTSKDGNLTAIWRKIYDALGYTIEIDGVEYDSDSASYVLPVNENEEHKIRIRANRDGEKSAWSEYIYHYLNSTMDDARVIERTSVTQDKLYETGQQKWYRLNAGLQGIATVSLTDIPDGCTFSLVLCDSLGKEISRGVKDDESGNISINNAVLSKYDYYVKITSMYGGSDTESYTLTVNLAESHNENMPSRVKISDIGPNGLEPDENTQIQSDSSSEDMETYEFPAETKQILHVAELSSGGAIDNEAYEENLSDEYMAAAKNEMDDIYTTAGNTTTTRGSITRAGEPFSKYYMASYTTGSSTSLQCAAKYVISVVPDNPSDVFSIHWCNDTAAFGKLAKSNYVEYTDADGNLCKRYWLVHAGLRTGTTRRDRYKVTLESKASGSTGEYTIIETLLTGENGTDDFIIDRAANDLPTNAYEISSSISERTGKIDHPLDRDIYKVYLEEGAKISYKLIAPEGKNYKVGLYNNDCSKDEYTGSQAYTSYYNSENRMSYGTVVSNKRGYFMLLIEADKQCGIDNNYSETEEYMLSVYITPPGDVGDIEPNDNFESADSQLSLFSANYLGIGSTSKTANIINFTLDSPIDEDMYKTTLNKGDKLSILMELPDDYDDNFYQYRIAIDTAPDSDGNFTRRTYDNPNSRFSKFVTFVADEAGTYYVTVLSESEQFSTSIHGSLRITQTAQNQLDEYEFNENEKKPYDISNDFAFANIDFFGLKFSVYTSHDIGDINSQGKNINATLDNELDVDWYRFEASANPITVTCSATTTSNAVRFALYSRDETGMEEIEDCRIGITYTFTPGQTYYIAVYTQDGYYGYIYDNGGYQLGIAETGERSNLIFNPLEWGTFVYDNDPEYITEDDLADFNLGNRFLMSADNLGGIVDFQSSHSAQAYMIRGGNISFDALLYNPTSETVSVDIISIGYQLPAEATDKSDWGQTQWACLQAWADFMNFDIKDDILIGNETDKYKKNYKNYNFRYIKNQLPGGGHYEIEPGQAVWMLGDSAPTMRTEAWSVFNIASRFRISDGGCINFGFAAFRNRDNIYTPKSAKLIYDIQTQRSYPEEYMTCYHMCDCICTCSCGADGETVYERDCNCETGCLCKKNSCTHYCVKEHDLNGKPKGISYSAAESITRTQWTITDTNEYFTPTVYNYTNPDGYTLGGTENDSWVTHFNPNADMWSYWCGVESDVLPLYFSDRDDETGSVTRKWTFDSRHTKPLSGNDIISGNAPVENAMPLGNYGVTERYFIDVTNVSESDKTISYIMSTASHVIIRYKFGDGEWQTRIKVVELSDKKTYEQFENDKKQIIFDENIMQGESKQLIIEITLPNGDPGGFFHQLKVS